MINGEFGEIIEASLQKYKAQSWSWNVIPAFGSLVITAETDIWGMVYEVHTAPSEPLRLPKALKLTELQLKNEHPQIFNFIETNFSAIVIGHNKKPIFYQLSPYAAKLHNFVKKASKEEELLFFKDHSYLHVIFENSNLIPNLNELILAIISRYQELDILNDSFINEFINLLSHLYGNDYTKLNLLLKRIDNLLVTKKLQVMKLLHQDL